MGDIANTLEYHSFRSTIPLKKIVVDDDHHKAWSLYDAGPRSVRCPLIFFPPASGTADVFFKQILALSTVGYRVIAVDYPVYWTLKEICEGFQKLLDHLQLDKVHIFGASLGGFIAQKFAEHTSHSPRVMSLLVCNSFNDTSIFQQTNAAPTFWMMPALFLKKMVIGSFQKGMVDSSIADSIDFLVDKLDGLSQKVLASRLTLNCMSSYVEPQKLNSVDITIMDVFDECALSQMVKDEMYKCYPDAKRAHLKSGGNFPYLSRSLEVNVFIKVHLQKYEGTKFSAKEESEPNDLIQMNNKPVYHYNQNEEDTKSYDLNEKGTKSNSFNEKSMKSNNLNGEDTKTSDLNEEDTKTSDLNEEDTKTVNLNEEDTKTVNLNEEDTKTVNLNVEDTKTVELNEEDTKASNLNEEDTKASNLNEEDSKTGNLNEEDSETGDLNVEDTKASNLNEEDTKTGDLNEEDTKTGDLNEEDAKTSVSNEQDLKTNDLTEQELPVNNNNTDQNSIQEIPNNSLNHSDTES